MSKDQYTAKQFITAMPGTGGIITTLAQRVGCSWNTAKKYVTEYATVTEAYIAECERVNDMAEGVLMKSIQEGNTQDAKWWLSRVRPEKFSDVHRLTGGDGKGPIEVTMVEVLLDNDSADGD